MSTLLPGLPSPETDPTTDGYWTGAGRGELLIGRCSQCGTDRHPPTEACYVCGCLDWAWIRCPGRGTVYSYTWADKPVLPSLAALGTYNVSVIELQETHGVVRILASVTDVERAQLVIGLPVEVHFDPVGEGLALPMFRPITPEASL